MNTTQNAVHEADKIVGYTPSGLGVTQNERIAAARLRVASDEALGEVTPEWIVDLSKQKPIPRPTPLRVRIAAARARVTLDRLRNETTPQDIVELAQSDPH